MGDYFNCKLCDKPIKIKSKKKHLNSINHKYLSDSIIFRYNIQSPGFLKIDNTLKNYVLDYNKKFESYTIICKWILHFSDTIVSVKSDVWWIISENYYLRNFLISKIKYFESQYHKSSQISEMNITFIANWRKMTCEYYLSPPKPMIEWKLNAILHKNPQLVTLLDDSIHPLITKYARIYHDVDGEN